MNSARAITAVLLLALIAFLCRYSSYKLREEHPDISDLLDKPQAHHGKQIYLKGRVAEASEKEFTLHSTDYDYTVRVSGAHSCKQGDEVMVVGTFDKEGFLVAINVRVVPYLKYKGAISYLLAIVVMVIFLFQFFTSYDLRKWQIY